MHSFIDDVPMAWLCAQQDAYDLVVGHEAPRPASVESRVAREVLALTLMLAGLETGTGELSVRQLDLIRDRLADYDRWCEWCQNQLDNPADTLTSADLVLAHTSWRRLGWSRLLTDVLATGGDGGARHVGLDHARLLLDLHRAQRYR